MQPLLLAALVLVLLLLVAALGVVGYLVYRLSGLTARHAAEAEATRRAAEETLAARAQALEARLTAARLLAEEQVKAARAETDSVRRDAAQYIQTELQTRTAAIQQAAQAALQQWRDGDLGAARAQAAQVAQGEAQNHLAQWKAEHEDAIRQDAIGRSRAVIAGKVTEHFVPYLPDFPYNPKDARFVGTPIDLIVFDGLDEGEVRKVVLIEVKTGSSSLSTRERRVREAVQAGRVEWRELRPKLDFTATVTPALDGSGVAIVLDAPVAGGADLTP